MKRQFVQTTNVQAFLASVSALQNRGAEEACLMVVDGEPGRGKTTVIQWWSVKTGSIFLRAKQEWTPRWMMHELLDELQVSPEYSFERMYSQAIAALAARAEEAARAGEDFAVIIDEVDYISRNRRILETLRDLSDFLEIPFILVGMGRVRKNLTRFPQVASRVGQYVEFHPATRDDVTAMADGLIDTKVKEDLLAQLHDVSGGRAREIKEGLQSIERFGARNRGQEIGVAEMTGQTLLNDRKTGRPIKVRAV